MDSEEMNEKGEGDEDNPLQVNVPQSPERLSFEDISTNTEQIDEKEREHEVTDHENVTNICEITADINKSNTDESDKPNEDDAIMKESNAGDDNGIEDVDMASLDISSTETENLHDDTQPVDGTRDSSVTQLTTIIDEYMSIDDNSDDPANITHDMEHSIEEVQLEMDLSQLSDRNSEGESENILPRCESSNVEKDECILPDTSKSSGDTEFQDTDEEHDVLNEKDKTYIVTNAVTKDSFECMHCKKNQKPKYACSYYDDVSYICTEECLKGLKDEKMNLVVRDLRVKTFAAVASQDESLDVTAPPPSKSLKLCAECSEEVVEQSYFVWNAHKYCDEICLLRKLKNDSLKCAQCGEDVPESTLGKYGVRFGMEMMQFCKNSCLLEHKKARRFCNLCQEELPSPGQGNFCSSTCSEVNRPMVNKKIGQCTVCFANKKLEISYSDGEGEYGFCGEPCFVAYKFVKSLNATCCNYCKCYKDKTYLDHQFLFHGKEYQLCSPSCLKLFLVTTRKIVHCLWCNVKKYNYDMIQVAKHKSFTLLCSLNCYILYQKSMNSVQEKRYGCEYCHTKNVKSTYHLTTMDAKVHNFCSIVCLGRFREKAPKDSDEVPMDDTSVDSEASTESSTSVPEEQQVKHVRKIVVTKPMNIPDQRNMSTMCKPYQITKSINCHPKETSKSVQTEVYSNKFLLPVPVPIFVPVPLAMYTHPVPTPFPFPVPVPVPIFIPTRRNSIKGILKEIDKVKYKVPADPLEAELLRMAEMVAEDKKDDSNSESEGEGVVKSEPLEQGESAQTKLGFGEDVVQMTLKMADGFERGASICMDATSTGTIASTSQVDSAQRIESVMEAKRRNIRKATQGAKKKEQPAPTPEQVLHSFETEKGDGDLCLKYTFGVNAWKQWVATKNIELQKTSSPLLRVKLFKSDILQLTADELNYSMCLFVKEVRKPNGSEYAPDTIYYLCLGIQQFLYENGRIDNIFCDSFYEKFTDCLNDVGKKFSTLYNESQYIVTRVEEEHLWESKQLGAHSPLVLLNTLMFFNTKHFSLTTVDEHLQLSFSHIMKHWKRNPALPGARNVLLRFYPPQRGEGPRKRKVYEQQENEDNPLRCPVKLYEFYLSKCPESVKTRNDVFYLLPERSCVPDSPVWYSTMALDKEPLERMLNRIKMVKEINVALLSS